MKNRDTMPLYEYKCGACGQFCEQLEKVSDPPSTICPHCQKPDLQRQLSAAAFHLKGSGWYVTDFRDKQDKKPDNKQSSDSKAAKDSSSAETKTTTETKDTTSKDSKKSEKSDP